MSFLNFTAALCLIISAWPVSGSMPQDTVKAARQDQAANHDSAYVSPFAAENSTCFKCHGQGKYQYSNENLGTRVSALMCPDRIIKEDLFYSSNHKSFKCTDCHSPEYEKFPHPGELRMEQMYACLDCHGGDEKYAVYHFEKIDSQYRNSVHFKLENEGFTCWECHNPHTYTITARNRNELSMTIAYDNSICLDCHSDFNRFQLLTENKEVNLIAKHDWLPNQAAHFASVRCIECHARANDTLLISHLIKPKEESVRDCNECHSRNSLLMASLYKYESMRQRSGGFVNGVMLNQSYVIGANRNKYLNIISVAIFAAVLAVISLHIALRVKNGRKTKKLNT